ncbi:hypothetical protein ACVOMV_37370 [Mesorhizobium atlanticum]
MASTTIAADFAARADATSAAMIVIASAATMTALKENEDLETSPDNA